MDNIYFVIWFFLPAGIANASAALSARLPFFGKLNYPIDMYKTYKGIRVFGDHKTIRGLIAGIIIAIAVLYLQQTIFFDVSQSFDLIDYNSINIWILGSLLGGGALIGDAFKSFFKRRHDLKPGAAWFPFDQIDYILGSSLLSYFYIPLDWHYYLLYLFVGLLAHLITNFLGYLLGLKDVPY